MKDLGHWDVSRVPKSCREFHLKSSAVVAVYVFVRPYRTPDTPQKYGISLGHPRNIRSPKTASLLMPPGSIQRGDLSDEEYRQVAQGCRLSLQGFQGATCAGLAIRQHGGIRGFKGPWLSIPGVDSEVTWGGPFIVFSLLFFLGGGGGGKPRLLSFSLHWGTSKMGVPGYARNREEEYFRILSILLTPLEILRTTVFE